MRIYPPSNKVATIPEDSIANAVFCCDCKLARLHQQVQQLQGMEIQTIDWNTKPFFLILAISNIVTIVPKIQFQILVAHFGFPTSGSSVPERGRTVIIQILFGVPGPASSVPLRGQ
ncbi:hypothetical protein TNCV_4043211 [Trichonephila clavipes]|nr:hypothetical protein TNCV_4043211 [Trichonephila clavipes]